MRDGAAVYGLIDPRDSEIRYIGCATNVQQRYQQHCKSGGTIPVAQWNTELRELGLKPKLVILCELSFAEDVCGWARHIASDTVEREMIQFYDRHEVAKPLLNVTHTNKAHEYMKASRERLRAQRQQKMEFMP